MRRALAALAAMGFLFGSSSAALSQDGAKALFYGADGVTQAPPPPAQPAAAAAKPAPPPVRQTHMGIKYWIELVGADGRRLEVAPTRVFQSGDRIKLRVETNRDGYLYLLSIGSTGRQHVLFPHPPDGSNLVKARTVYDVPYGAFIRFDDNPGVETLWVMLSQSPMRDIVPNVDPRTMAVPREDEMRLLRTAELRGSKDLVLEVDSGGQAPGGYAVAPLASLGDQGLLYFDIKLRHR